jgi:FkbM family methyltransferase
MTAPVPLSRSQLSRLFERQERGGLFETLIRWLYSSVLRAGDHAVDGGAHLGLHTFPMARAVKAAGRIHAYEPVPSLHAKLSRHARKWPNIWVSRIALSDHDGSSDFDYLPDDPALSSIVPRELHGSPRSERITVELARLDTLASQPIRFIKLDLEGGEYHAMRGGRRLIAAQQPVIMFECGRIDGAVAYGYGAEDFFSLFDSIGYGLRTLFGDPFTPEDWERRWNDRSVPHYLAAAPVGRVDAIAGLLRHNVDRALWGPPRLDGVRNRLSTDALRNKLAALAHW